MSILNWFEVGGGIVGALMILGAVGKVMGWTDQEPNHPSPVYDNERNDSAESSESNFSSGLRALKETRSVAKVDPRRTINVVYESQILRGAGYMPWGGRYALPGTAIDACKRIQGIADMKARRVVELNDGKVVGTIWSE
jgi:hypothetical protein